MWMLARKTIKRKIDIISLDKNLFSILFQFFENLKLTEKVGFRKRWRNTNTKNIALSGVFAG